MKPILLSLFALFMFGASALATDSRATLERELQVLEQELPDILKEEVDLDTQQAYVNRVLALREKLSALEEEVAEPTEGKNQTVLILKRIMLKYRTKGSGLSDYQIEENYNQDGFTSEGSDGNWVRTLKVEEYPTKIVIGEPFTFKATAARRAGHSRIHIDLTRSYTASGLGGGAIEMQAAGSHRAASGQPSIPVTVNAEFSFQEDIEKYGTQYSKYVLKAQTDGRFELTNDYDKYPNANTLVLKKKNPSGKPPSSTGPALIVQFLVPIDPSIGSSSRAQRRKKEEEKQLEFVYQYAKADDMPVTVAAFQLPDDLGEAQKVAQEENTSPDSDDKDDSSLLAGSSDVTRGDGKEPSQSTNGAGTETASNKDPRRTSEPTDGDSATSQPVRTTELSPDNPDVVQLMAEWLTKAEPPQNATEESNFRYNGWGQLEGTSADGGVVEPNRQPDAAAGRTPIEHVWAERDKLDSVDHCTLGEFVERRLAGENLESCHGRYVALVPDLVGLHIGQFKTQLDNRGFNIQWQDGPVSNDPALIGTVEKQTPEPGTRLKDNRQVKLWIYHQPITTVEVPNVVGMTFANAKAKLRKAGLKAKFGKMDPSNPFTLNPKQKILTQEAEAGTKVAKGTKVVLNFAKEGSEKKRPSFSFGSLNTGTGKPRIPNVLTRPQYKKVRMPDVIGMPYEKAASKLKSVGLKPIPKLGPKAPHRALANTVKETEHPANRLVDADSNIRLTVYDSYRERKQPDTIVKRDPASAFGGRKNPPPASAGGGSSAIPDRMNCEARVGGLRTSNKKRVASLQHGEVGVRKDGIADYVCWYVTSKGQEVLVKPSFFVRKPETRESGKKGRNLIAFCDRPAYSDVYGVGAHGKAMKMTIGKYSSNKLTQSQLQQLVNFHTNQMATHAISCSASSRPTPPPPRKTQPLPLPPNSGSGLDMPTAGSCRQLPPPPSHMGNPTCQCSEANALFGTTTYTTCYWVDKN